MTTNKLLRASILTSLVFALGWIARPALLAADVEIAIDPAKIRDVQVLTTIVDGKVVFERK